MAGDFKFLRGITPDMQLSDSDLRQSRITTDRMKQQTSILPFDGNGESPNLGLPGPALHSELKD
jgi:hypothetical protein